MHIHARCTSTSRRCSRPSSTSPTTSRPRVLTRAVPSETGRDAFNDTDPLYEHDLELTLSREGDGYLGLITLRATRKIGTCAPRQSRAGTGIARLQAAQTPKGGAPPRTTTGRRGRTRPARRSAPARFAQHGEARRARSPPARAPSRVAGSSRAGARRTDAPRRGALGGRADLLVVLLEREPSAGVSRRAPARARHAGIGTDVDHESGTPSRPRSRSRPARPRAPREESVPSTTGTRGLDAPRPRAPAGIGTRAPAHLIGYPSGATQIRQPASRRSRRAAARKRSRLVSLQVRPEHEQAGVLLAHDLEERGLTGLRVVTRSSSVFTPSSAARRAVARTASRSSSCGRFRPSARPARASSDRPQPQDVRDHERHAGLDRAVDRHPLGARIDPHGQRPEHHRPLAGRLSSPLGAAFDGGRPVAPC